MTYAWGSPDIISIFTKPSNRHIIANAYTPENEDFSGKTSTTRLDTWVFDKVIDFLHRDGRKLAEKERSIFFLHLLGLDTGLAKNSIFQKKKSLKKIRIFYSTAGHVHKPNTEYV